MIVTKELALKGAAGLATAAATTTAVVYRNEISSLFVEKPLTLVELAKKVNLSCSSSGSLNECTFDSTNNTTNVFESENKKVTGATVIQGTGKIKFESDQTDYNLGFRFFVETADVSLTSTLNSSGINNLPVGATYEIKQEGNEWFLKRVWDVGKLAANLGLTSCVDGNDGKVCDLASNATVNVMEGDGTTNKTVGATTSAEGKIKFVKMEADYNLGFKLTVESENAINLTGGTITGTAITSLVKANTSYEMKFNDNKWFFSKKVNG